MYPSIFPHDTGSGHSVLVVHGTLWSDTVLFSTTLIFPETYSHHFSVNSLLIVPPTYTLKKHLFGLWEERCTPGGNLHAQSGRVCANDTETTPRSKSGCWSCEAAALLVAPLSCRCTTFNVVISSQFHAYPIKDSLYLCISWESWMNIWKGLHSLKSLHRVIFEWNVIILKYLFS